MKTKIHLFSIYIALSVPIVSNAAFGLADSNFKGVVGEAVSILNLIIPILAIGSFIVFFWGVTKFVINSSNDKELIKGKTYMKWSILVLFILISYRTIISLVTSDLGFGDSSSFPFLKTDATTSSAPTTCNGLPC